MKILKVISIVGIVFFSSFLNANGSLRAIDFDIDKDGRLTYVESTVYFGHLNNRSMASFFDEDRDGETDEKLLSNVSDEVKTLASETMRAIERDGYDKYISCTRLLKKIEKSDLSYEEAESDNCGAINKKKPPKKKGGEWVVASESNHLSLFSKDKSLDKRDSAEFGYSANKRESEESITANGAVYWNGEISEKVKRDDFGFWDYSRYGVSATFNRVHADDEEDEVDSLDLRLTYTTDTSKWDGRLLLSASLLHSTDFDFESETYGAELKFTPAEFNEFLGKLFPIGEYIYTEFQPSFELVWLDIVNPAVGSDFEEDDSLTAIGVGIDFTLWPRLISLPEKPSLNIKYKSNNAFSGDKYSTDLWKAKIGYPLNSKGTAEFSLSFEEGEEFLKNKPIRTLTVGLGFKM